jgi:hypothetical protein
MSVLVVVTCIYDGCNMSNALYSSPRGPGQLWYDSATVMYDVVMDFVFGIFGIFCSF